MILVCVSDMAPLFRTVGSRDLSGASGLTRRPGTPGVRACDDGDLSPRRRERPLWWGQASGGGGAARLAAERYSVTSSGRIKPSSMQRASRTVLAWHGRPSAANFARARSTYCLTVTLLIFILAAIDA